MGFFYKLKSAVRKIKNKLIVFGILVIAIIFWLIIPFTVAKVNAETVSGIKISQDLTNSSWWSTFLMQIGEGITAPWNQIGICFSEGYISTFIQALKWVLIFSGLCALIGILKALPKHEYEDIENGSSDWSEGGEQYKVLNRNKGIVLAEKNYLPVDKRGNINVLVVRWFWCW